MFNDDSNTIALLLTRSYRSSILAVQEGRFSQRATSTRSMDLDLIAASSQHRPVEPLTCRTDGKASGTQFALAHAAVLDQPSLLATRYQQLWRDGSGCSTIQPDLD